MSNVFASHQLILESDKNYYVIFVSLFYNFFKRFLQTEKYLVEIEVQEIKNDPLKVI